jgi:hypothetical protein
VTDRTKRHLAAALLVALLAATFLLDTGSRVGAAFDGLG